MTVYAGFDVSDKTTHICVVDADGGVVRRDVVATDPAVLAQWLGKHAPAVERVVLDYQSGTGCIATGGLCYPLNPNS